MYDSRNIEYRGEHAVVGQDGDITARSPEPGTGPFFIKFRGPKLRGVAHFDITPDKGERTVDTAIELAKRAIDQAFKAFDQIDQQRKRVREIEETLLDRLRLSEEEAKNN